MSIAQQAAKAYGGVFANGQACVPTLGHTAKDRGTTIKDAPGAPDGVVIHVHNSKTDALQAALAMKDDMRGRGLLGARQAAASPSDNRPHYWYTDADGARLYAKVRVDLPGSKYRVRDVSGEWKRKHAPVPYRLPDLIKADPGATLFMAEGEKHADKLASWGLLATSHKDWRKDFAEHVAGRTVVILPDNDVAGEKQAEDTARFVKAAGGNPIIVKLPDLPPGGDIMDWTGDCEALEALVVAAINPAPELLPLIDLTKWEGIEPPDREWQLYEYMPKGQVTYLTGPGSAGKSLLAQLLATCMAVGMPWLGVETVKAVSIYVTAENDTAELQRRHKAACDGLGIMSRTLIGKLHLVSIFGMTGNELATFDQSRRMSLTDRYRMIEATVQAKGATFLVLDNVAPLFAGDENNRHEVASFISLLNRLANDTGCRILLIGHPNKAGAEYSGSTAWENQFRSRLFLQTPEAEEGGVANPDIRTLSRGKANYARKGEALSFLWHKWTFVPESELPANTVSDMSATLLASADNDTFLQCLDERVRQERAVSENKA